MKELHKFLINRHALATDTLSEFEAKFRENPRHALEWSLSVFSAAAMLPHTSHLCSAAMDDDAEEHCTVEKVLEYLNKHFDVAARNFTNRSTSGADNLLRDYEVSGLAKLIDDIKMRSWCFDG